MRAVYVWKKTSSTFGVVKGRTFFASGAPSHNSTTYDPYKTLDYVPGERYYDEVAQLMSKLSVSDPPAILVPCARQDTSSPVSAPSTAAPAASTSASVTSAATAASPATPEDFQYAVGLLFTVSKETGAHVKVKGLNGFLLTIADCPDERVRRAWLLSCGGDHERIRQVCGDDKLQHSTLR